MKVMYSNGISAIVKTDDNKYALVKMYEKEDEYLVSNYAESFLKFGYFNKASDSTLSKDELAMVKQTMETAKPLKMN